MIAVLGHQHMRQEARAGAGRARSAVRAGAPGAPSRRRGTTLSGGRARSPGSGQAHTRGFRSGPRREGAWRRRSPGRWRQAHARSSRAAGGPAASGGRACVAPRAGGRRLGPCRVGFHDRLGERPEVRPRSPRWRAPAGPSRATASPRSGRTAADAAWRAAAFSFSTSSVFTFSAS